MKWRAIMAHPRLRGWVFYDVGNSAFATTIMVVLYPLFYQNVLSAGMDPSRSRRLLGVCLRSGAALRRPWGALCGGSGGCLGEA